MVIIRLVNCISLIKSALLTSGVSFTLGYFHKFNTSIITKLGFSITSLTSLAIYLMEKNKHQSLLHIKNDDIDYILQSKRAYKYPALPLGFEIAGIHCVFVMTDVYSQNPYKSLEELAIRHCSFKILDLLHNYNIIEKDIENLIKHNIYARPSTEYLNSLINKCELHPALKNSHFIDTSPNSSYLLGLYNLRKSYIQKIIQQKIDSHLYYNYMSSPKHTNLF